MGTVSINVIIPFFAIMMAGYLAAVLRLLPEGSSAVLNRFVFVVSLPALFVLALSRVPVAEFFNWPFLGALGGGMLIVFCIAWVVARLVFPDSLTANGLHGLTAMFSSMAYIGLPLLLTVFGDVAMVPGIIGAVITGAVFAPIAIVIAELDQNRQGTRRIWTSLGAIFASPPILATVVGLSLSATGIVLPVPIATFCELLGGAFVPCVLFSAGLFIASCALRGASLEIGWLVVAKLLIHPVITWWLAYHVFALQGPLPAIVVIQAALPTGVPVFIFVQEYKTFMTRSSAAIAWSTGLSVLTLSVLLLYLQG